MKLQIAILLALIYACTLNAQLTVTGRIAVKNNTDSIHEMTIKNMMMKTHHILLSKIITMYSR